MDKRFLTYSARKKITAKINVILVNNANPMKKPTKKNLRLLKYSASESKTSGTPKASTKYDDILIMLIENNTVEKTKNKESHKESILLNVNDLEIE